VSGGCIRNIPLVYKLGVNYYPHHIGDYLRDTAHLTPLEDGIYRRLLDVYYANEKPLPPETQWVCKLVRARTTDEIDAVIEVLRQYFTRSPEGWRNKRADMEIRAHYRRVKAAKDNGKRGGRPKNPVGLREKPSGLAESTFMHNPSESSQNQIQTQSIKSIVGLKPNQSEAALVLTYLNEQSGRDYRPVNGNISLIAARLREGATVEDCKAVIDRKVEQWRGGEMEKYLRPATLFNATKFAQYQGETAVPTGVKYDA
jgi:uncharacterized phage protein (TIGR02220 family)